ncbi:hypothetical protein V6Z12_A10G126700 [Gossypium hirsutum]
MKGPSIPSFSYILLLISVCLSWSFQICLVFGIPRVFFECNPFYMLLGVSEFALVYSINFTKVLSHKTCCIFPYIRPALMNILVSIHPKHPESTDQNFALCYSTFTKDPSIPQRHARDFQH